MFSPRRRRFSAARLSNPRVPVRDCLRGYAKVMGPMFNLPEFTERVREVVEREMAARLSSAGVESTRLLEAMRYSFFSGGKRIRPVLVFAAAEFIRRSRGAPAPERSPLPETLVALAVESIHTYSLIHDDLPAMDNDDLRRGKPTCHIAFDEATAILAGDALLNLGFQFLLEGVELYGSPLLKAARVIGDATGIGGMVTGQMLDLESVHGEPSPETVTAIHRNKTGALLKACVRAGGYVGGADGEQAMDLAQYGECIGLAFQIVDDLLDLEKTTEQLGKRAGKDKEQNKPTYPAVYGREASHRMAEELTLEAETILLPYGQAAEPLHALADLILRRDH